MADEDYNEIIHFEEAPFKEVPVYCEDKNVIEPRQSDFEILEYALMSSKQGHRYALITIKNTSSGQRSINNQHMIAILANCKRSYPLNLEHKFDGNEIVTMEVNFGIKRFPILKVTAEK